MNFSGKNVLITGGSRGIGRAIALAFAGRGARVALNFHRDQAAAMATLNELGNSAEHLALKADLADPEATRRMVELVVREFGRIDILINNAGIYRAHPLPETSYEEWLDAWRQTLDTNLVGAANLCYLVGRHMIEQRSGRIVNITSRGAFRGEPDYPAYAASKAGLNALSQSLARALGPFGIGVNALAPGFVETDMTADLLAGKSGEAIRAQSPLNRVAQPEEVAAAVLFLASAEAGFTTGAILDLNGASYLRS